MQEPRDFLGALFESVKTSMRTPIVLDIYGDAVDLIRTRDAEWQARVDRLEAALRVANEAMAERRAYAEFWEYKYGDTWDAEDAQLRAALGRE